MQKNKKQIFKYIGYFILIVLLIAYGVVMLLRQDQVGAIVGFGFGIFLLVAWLFNIREDMIDAKAREERKLKEPKATEELAEMVSAMKAKNQDIQAIKLVREQTGMSLYDAKNYVDSIAAKTQ